MNFFKNSSSKKNKTASAANTPLQTPRTSVQLNASDIPKQTLSHEQAIDLLLNKTTVGHMQTLIYARM
ncbi:hypothetical protein BGZ73_004500 [Actinomortierella ambigua]|nr:hypothetical protein BGZ73_004500 [Actinomortierella ambigua]